MTSWWQAFDVSGQPGMFALMVLPPLASALIGTYTLATQPRDSWVVLFLTSLMASIVHQVGAIGPAFCVTAECAVTWYRPLAFAPSIMAATGLHFVMLLSDWPWARRARVVLPLYGGALLVIAGYLGGAIEVRAEVGQLFRWVVRTSGPLDTYQRLYGATCIALVIAFVAKDVVKWRHHPSRGPASRWVGAGLLLPMLGAVFVVMRATQIPLYRIAIPGFHLCVWLAIRRYGVGSFSIEESAQPALDALGEGVVVVDGEGAVVYGNRAARELHQLTAASVPEPELLPGVSAALCGQTARGVAVTVGGVPALAAFTPLHQRGRALAAVVLTDVRALRDTERDLIRAREEAIDARRAAEQASRAKDTFLANMSHELRTPLNAIIGYAELLEEERPDDQETLSRIVRSGQYLLRLLDDVLDLSKLDAGRLLVHCEPMDLAQVLEEVRPAAGVLAERQQNGLRIEAPSLWVQADPIRVRQIILNLLSNACKFTSNGHITLSIRVDGDRGVLEVADDGIGMDEEQMRRLFTRFEQVHRENHGRYGGTGLGLALSRQLARRMGGELWAESARSRGSIFRCALPLAAR